VVSATVSFSAAEFPKLNADVLTQIGIVAR
jgi:hypothetical protein